MVEWARRLDDFDRKGWHNVATVERGPSIEYVGLVNRAQDHEDRVVVRVESTLRDVVRDRNGRHHHAQRQPVGAHDARRVLDAGQARRGLDPALDRAGRRGLAPP